MIDNSNAQEAQYSPHNVLGMAVKPVYLTDPMNSVPETSTGEPQDAPESDEPTSTENPDKTTQEHDWKKRHSDLKSHYDRYKLSTDSKINELSTTLNEVSGKLTEVSSAKFTPPKTPEEYRIFKEKYPELVAMIETSSIMAAESKSSVIEKKLEQLEARQNNISAKEGINELKKYHPDFEEIKDDPRFHDWFYRQGPATQNLIRSPDPKDIALGLDKFKEHAGIKTSSQKAEEKKNLTREVKTGPQRVKIEDASTQIWTDALVDKLPLNEFERLLPEIRKAQLEGRYKRS